jgi:hypothetical protein
MDINAMIIHDDLQQHKGQSGKPSIRDIIHSNTRYKAGSGTTRTIRDQERKEESKRKPEEK